MDLITAVLAERIEIRDDKLYVDGGAYAWFTVGALPATIAVRVGLVLVAEQGEGLAEAVVQLGVAGPDGQIRPELHVLRVPWPTLIAPVAGQPVVVPIAYELPVDVLDPGRHTVIVFLGDAETSRAALPFAVRQGGEAGVAAP